VSGDLVVVGANGDDTGATDAGAAYVFDAANGSLLCTLNNPTPAASDQFGWSVAVSGSTVVVGAYSDDTGATDAGAAYVFDATTGNLLQTLNNPTPASSDQFGMSVAVSGSTVVVGAYSDDTGATDAGAAYVFDAATGDLLQAINNPTLTSSEYFGSSVAVSGSTVVVGAYGNDAGAADAGAAYVFGDAVSAPWATAFSPANGATWIDHNTNLTIAFSEYVQKGIGNIVIKSADGSVIESIDVSSPQVTISGAIATIDPGATLENTTYYVEVSNGAFEDLTGNAFAGISGPAAWSFTTLNYIPLASLPALHSNPGAPTTIYLDFNGHVEPVFGSYTNAATAVYDIDGDPTTLNDPELANIRTIWETVAEDFAPFNVDVTTVEPAVLAPGRPIADANGVALRIAIGPEVNGWAGGSYGKSFWGSFNNSGANVAFAFSGATRPVAGIARYASMEAGFSCWVPTQAWNGVIGGWEPITSAAIFSYSTPAIWYDGTDPYGYHQDDLADLAGCFGYRADDYGDTTATATALTQVGSAWSGAGIIGANTDVDVFSFTVPAEGAYRIAANAAAVAPNLDAVLELRNAAGQLIAVANPQDTQSAQIVKSLTPGKYYLSVQSTGVYGWIGQYTVAIDNAPPAGISVLTTSRTLTTGEDGRQASFQVQLTTRPAAAVTIAVTSSSTAEGTVAAPSLTFTPDNWNLPQTVTVIGVDDAIVEADAGYKVLLTPSSSDPAYNTFSATKASITNLDNDTKFYVVNDGSPDKAYEYATSGGQGESYGLNSGNTAPRGVATTAAGDKTWVVDANRKVYVYNTSGGLLGSWTAGTLNNKAVVEDITVYGNDVWIVDANSDKVYRYNGAASRLSGTQNATSSFNLDRNNHDPKGIVTDGTSLWVVNDSTYPDEVFKYTVAGQLLGSWHIDAHNAKPTGLTINPASPSSIWIVDSGTKSVYQYANATSATSGVRSAVAVFALAAGNTNPQGIADPPLPGSMVATRPRAPAASVSRLLDAAFVGLSDGQPKTGSTKTTSTVAVKPRADFSTASVLPRTNSVVSPPLAAIKSRLSSAGRRGSAVPAVDHALTTLAGYVRPEAAAVDYLMSDLADRARGRKQTGKSAFDLLLAEYDAPAWL